VVEENNYHVRHRVSKECMFNYAENYDSVVDHVRIAMANEMAQGLLKTVPIRRVSEDSIYSYNTDPYWIEYQMDCIILDEHRYRELLKAERDLRTLRGIVNGK
jgi:hypothetical protein